MPGVIMESWKQVLDQLPYLRDALDILCIVLPFSALFAFSGIFFLCVTAEMLARSRQRTVYDKCARQLALLGVILGWTLLVGSRVWLHFSPRVYSAEQVGGFVVETSWLLLSLGVLLSSIYFTLWRPLKNMPILHMTLGMISAVQNCLALAAILATLRIVSAFASPEAAGLTLPDIFPGRWGSPLWSTAAYTLPLIFAMPGAFGAVWLPMRRKHDDFGRDYYNAMMTWCCAWSRNAWAALWLLVLAGSSLQIWLEYRNGVFNTQNAITESSRALFWLVPFLLWLLVIRSRHALRHRFTLFVAMLLAVSFMLPYYLELSRLYF